MVMAAASPTVCGAAACAAAERPLVVASKSHVGAGGAFRAAGNMAVPLKCAELATTCRRRRSALPPPASRLPSSVGHVVVSHGSASAEPADPQREEPVTTRSHPPPAARWLSPSPSSSASPAEEKEDLTSRRSVLSLTAAILATVGLADVTTSGAGIGGSFLFRTGNDGVAMAVSLPPSDDTNIRLCNSDCERDLDGIPTVTTESGLQYKDIVVGRGPQPPIGFQVAANYVAMLPDGKIFDSSLEKGSPYIIRVGAGQVIRGLDEGVQTMKVGGKRRLYIPGNLAFPKGLTSAPGRPRVSANSAVVFDVQLLYVPGLEDDEE